ncbi:MAG TPA: ABC transporter ATP-binding protein [Devosia sp.]|jgi:iron complex transport system ATP-binding protein|nr:ABC transporter ATP-binding protein [Devosia sp.]
MLQPWSAGDDAAVTAAMAGTGVDTMRHRRIGSLSGGQLQRAWIAMVLAQETDTICLDEPVNHLDMAHQLDCLDLVTRLNRGQGRTIVLVLHDLNLAARYADHLVFIANGRVRERGAPEVMMRSDLIAEVFSVDAAIITDPVHQRPICIPHRRYAP